MARVSPRLLVLELGATGAETDRSAELSKIEFHSNPSEAEFTSFEEGRAGGARDYTAELTMTQDHAASSLWTTIFDNAGTTLNGVYNPYGPAVTEPTVAQPFFGIKAVVSEPEGLLMGGEATNSQRAVASIEVVWELEGKPEKLESVADLTAWTTP